MKKTTATLRFNYVAWQRIYHSVLHVALLTETKFGSNWTLQKQHVFLSQDKDKVLLYKLRSASPHINLHLHTGNYGEDTISNQIVGCYLFPGRCRIRH